MAQLQKLIDRAEELGIADEVADLLAAYIDAAEAFEANRDHPVDATAVVMLAELPSAVWALGELARIEYDRLEDGKAVRRYHDFEDQRPTLAVGVDDSKLWIIEGDYTVTARGIVG